MMPYNVGKVTDNILLEEMNNKLKGHNKIVIEQMKLGEKITSDKAVDLPLQLALALLTDSKGVIDMEIPVGGNVDDPQFNVGSIVMGALVNLITKAVTSPFTLLASLPLLACCSTLSQLCLSQLCLSLLCLHPFHCILHLVYNYNCLQNSTIMC